MSQISLKGNCYIHWSLPLFLWIKYGIKSDGMRKKTEIGLICFASGLASSDANEFSSEIHLYSDKARPLAKEANLIFQTVVFCFFFLIYWIFSSERLLILWALLLLIWRGDWWWIMIWLPPNSKYKIAVITSCINIILSNYTESLCSEHLSNSCEIWVYCKIIHL